MYTHSLIGQLSDREYDGFSAVITLHEVIDEIRVEQTLDNSCYKRCENNSVPVEYPGLHAQLPMEDVHNSVEAQKEHVVGRDVLHLLEPCDHGELRENCHRLQPNGERPHEVDGIEGFVDEHCHHEGAQVQ